MQKAVPVGEGSMAAILGLDFSDVQEIAAKATAQANNDNGKEKSMSGCE